MVSANAVANYIGYLGVVLILLCYFLLQAKRMNAQMPLYSWINLLASLMVLLSLYYHPNWPSIVIEVAWISISIYGILRPKLTRETDG